MWCASAVSWRDVANEPSGVDAPRVFSVSTFVAWGHAMFRGCFGRACLLAGSIDSFARRQIAALPRRMQIQQACVWLRRCCCTQLHWRPSWRPTRWWLLWVYYSATGVNLSSFTCLWQLLQCVLAPPRSSVSPCSKKSSLSAAAVMHACTQVPNSHHGYASFCTHLQASVVVGGAAVPHIGRRCG